MEFALGMVIGLSVGMVLAPRSRAESPEPVESSGRTAAVLDDVERDLVEQGFEDAALVVRQHRDRN